MLLNLLLNVALVWPFAEAGLAAATSISSAVQVGLLLWLFSKRQSHIDGKAIAATVARTLIASAVMYGAGYGALALMPPTEGAWNVLARVAAPMAAASLAFVATTAALKAPEWRHILARPTVDE